ncbi:hypothetical protein A9Q93_03375 [Nonlabens dokdonensis]|uniref:Methyltransferase FkbM domain-containing protein n=2 Tax=Nonlabens dokdonensis TaxID=328515 RepID=A0A1Z8B7Z3_9FLAO|nr:FkbM family methyltransferase [Nonlabens dokdonensis]OUS18670.1 hypothetical protein A9Q93_03375 [Nonlabens dokdonensis]
MIKKILDFPSKIFEHSSILGWSGFQLLFKRGLRSKKLIRVKPKGYHNAVFLRPKTTDITVFYQVFLAQSYQINIPLNPKIIIDCGANVGLSSVYFANRFPEAQVVAVEPESDNFNVLIKNISSYKNIIPINKGIWSHETNLKISNDQLGSWGFTIEESDKPEKNTIQATSLKTIMDACTVNSIDILKIDIEGSEKELFEKNVDLWLPYVKILIIELHDGLKAGSSKSVMKAVSKYDFYHIRNNENLIFYFN